MKYLFVFLAIFRSLAASAQPAQRATLTGNITNAADGKPLPFASVYLNGSTKGTTSDENGRFTLGDVPFGSVELVVSYTGFSAVRQSIRITEVRPRPVAIALSPLANQLADVVVRAQKDKVWLKQLRHFERELLGKGNFAGSCVLLNPDVLKFTEVGRTLLAEASAPLLIDNQALGYRLTYSLTGFRSQPERVTFGGTTLFNELTPDTPKQAKQWQRNREEAYRGSLRHLLASIAAGNYEKESFLIYLSDPTMPLFPNLPSLLSNEVGRHLKPFKPAEMVLAGTLPHERWLRSPHPLTVFYTRIASRESPYTDAPYAYSQLVLPKYMLGFTVTGQITAPLGFDAVGYLSNDRLGNALPDDWQHDAPPPALRRDSVRKQESDSRITTLGKSGPDADLDSLVRRWKRPLGAAAPAVFLHIDKPMYLTGDKLWLSAYLLNARTQRVDTALVGPALNVELWAANQTLVQHQWLPVTDGRAVGMFRLADTLATGTYWLRAYTEADRQQPYPAFERPVWLVNYRNGEADQLMDKPLIPAERGNEKPTNQFAADDPDAPLRARLTTDSSQVVLTLDSPQSSRDPAVFALIDNQEKLVQSSRIPARTRGLSTTVRWSTLTWPSGMVRLSLMDSIGRVWATRPVWVPNRTLPITMTATVGEPRAGTSGPRPLSLTLVDGAGRLVNAHVSVAITDADKVPTDSLVADFRTHMGSVKQPFWVSSTATAAPNITLHGQVTTKETLPVNVVVMVPDGRNVVARAVLTDRAGHFQVTNLALADTMQLLVRLTNERGKPIDGRVRFNRSATGFGPLPQWNGAEKLMRSWKNLIEAARERQNAAPLAYRQHGARQLREVVVRVTKPIDNRPDDIRQRSLHDKVDQTIVLNHTGPSFDNLYSLIRAKVPQTVVQQVFDNGQVKYSVKFNGGTVSSVAPVAAVRAIGSAPAPPVPNTPGSLQNPLFLLDGFPINDSDGLQLLAFSPNDIERIEVLKTGAVTAIYGLQGSRGVLAFYTKVPREGASVKGISRQVVMGYSVVPAFSPPAETAGSQPDVLSWVPSASTNQQGQLTVPVVVPPSLRLLRVTIQGVSDTGQPISLVKTLAVK